jgi:preprotein translocase subunit SecA
MPIKLIEDKVWWNNERKLEGICDEIRVGQSAGNVLLLSHFETGVAELETALRIRSIEFEKFFHADGSVLCAQQAGRNARLFVGQTHSLPAAPAHDPDVWGATRLQNVSRQSMPLTVIVNEHHPKRSRDEQVIATVRALTCEGELSFHIALDDPLLTHFGVRAVQDMFRRLNMNEKANLSSPLISIAICKAQEKIESQVPRDLPAISLQDWFKHNLPQK